MCYCGVHFGLPRSERTIPSLPDKEVLRRTLNKEFGVLPIVSNSVLCFFFRFIHDFKDDYLYYICIIRYIRR